MDLDLEATHREAAAYLTRRAEAGAALPPEDARRVADPSWDLDAESSWWVRQEDVQRAQEVHRAIVDAATREKARAKRRAKR